MTTETEKPLFRFAHISDLHFSKVTWSPTQFFSKRWIGNCNLLLSRKHNFSPERLTNLFPLFHELKIDTVLITGDLSSTSRKEEFTQALEFIEGLKQENFKVFTLPGNHDHYTKEAYRSKLFYQFFDESYAPSSAYSLKKDKFTLTPLGHNWWLLALDTALATSLLSSSGLFPADLEANLEKALKEIPADQRILMMNHFPLFSNDSASKELVRAEALQKLIEKFPQIKLYLHGHSHRHCIADLRNSGLPILLDSGSTGKKERATWNLIEITPKGCSVEVFKNQDNPNEMPWQPVLKTHFQW